MSEVKIKAFIFDIGGVLFLAKENGREKHLLSSFKEACFLLKEDGVDALSSFDTLFEIYKKSSVGEITKEETMNLMSNVLCVSAKKVEELFERAYVNNTIENSELFEFIVGLQTKGYKIGILSNQFHLSKNIFVPEKYYKHFDAFEISCDDGLKKPDEKAYISVLNKLKVTPQEAVFIDDKQGNLDVAKKLGMKSVLFENNKQFFLRLEELEI